MTAWRLVKKGRAGDPLSGEGARLYGGRWNHKGVEMVYASEHLSLAVLEIFVHLRKTDMTVPLVYFSVEIPDDSAVEELSLRDLPRNWRSEPPPASNRDIGTVWARRASSLALRVPSVIVTEEFNVLINPAHPDFPRIRTGPQKEFHLDSRLLRRQP